MTLLNNEVIMQYFQYQNKELFAEEIALKTIAEQYGTPCYVYSRAVIEHNWQAFNNALSHRPHRICYAVKANSNLAILNVLARLQSGFDIVSMGELERVLAAGGQADKIVFSGVGKKTAEIERALQVGIHCFNIESEAEIERIHQIAQSLQKKARIALRINPNIDAKTHPYIATGLKENKFGIEIDNILPLCAAITKMPYLELTGIACHIGSQLTDLSPVMEAIDRLLELITQLNNAGIHLQHLNVGGGLGICYQDEQPPTIQEYVTAINSRLASCPLEIILEPGRSLVANAGVLLTQVEYLKETPHRNFAIVDAAMNDLMRPALYNAWQNILPVDLTSTQEKKIYDVVGPVCESADFLGKERQLKLQVGELLAITDAGAYGFSMSSNYNSRPRVAEDQIHLIRRRETIDELFAHEIQLPAIAQ
jgi:diaminopimelate decarboxylase